MASKKRKKAGMGRRKIWIEKWDGFGWLGWRMSSWGASGLAARDDRDKWVLQLRVLERGDPWQRRRTQNKKRSLYFGNKKQRCLYILAKSIHISAELSQWMHRYIYIYMKSGLWFLLAHLYIYIYIHWSIYLSIYIQTYWNFLKVNWIVQIPKFNFLSPSHPSLSLFLSVCLSLFVYFSLYIYTHTHTYIYIYTHTHTHIYIYMCVYVCLCAHIRCLRWSNC